MTEEREACTINKRELVGAHVEADMNEWWQSWRVGPEEHAKNLRRAVKEFNDFLRDHRSQDLITLSVECEYKDFCSSCLDEWEADYNADTGETSCASCGAVLVTEIGAPCGKSS